MDDICKIHYVRDLDTSNNASQIFEIKITLNLTHCYHQNLLSSIRHTYIRLHTLQT